MRNSLENELSCLLRDKGIDMVHYVDISALPVSLNKGFPVAVLLWMKLTADYLLKVLLSVNYVQEMKSQNRMQEDEFHTAELTTDGLADFVAGFLVSKGYSAYSQSEKNLLAGGSYNTVTHTTALPHKTIALLAGMGWIGKHDLLVTPEYGSAISMCTVLTNAPLPSVLHPISQSHCGECVICQDECIDNAIKGTEWAPKVSRDEVVDWNACTTCLKCMVHCPWTRQYVRKALSYSY